jgi:hypothetical protein
MADASGKSGGHLRDFLIEKHIQRGEIVYSDFLEKGQTPEGWSGPFPDLIAIRDDTNIAICIESFTDKVSEHHIAKWKTMLNNPNTTLQIIVRNRISYYLVNQASKLHNLPLECKIMIKKTHSKRTHHDSLFNVRLLMVIFTLFLIFSFIVVIMLK